MNCDSGVPPDGTEWRKDALIPGFPSVRPFDVSVEIMVNKMFVWLSRFALSSQKLRLKVSDELSINQSTNQSVSQSNNQPTDRPTDRPFNQPNVFISRNSPYQELEPVNCSKSKEEEVKKGIAVCKPHRYGNSHTIWNHTVLPATQQMWHSRLYPSRSWYSI